MTGVGPAAPRPRPRLHPDRSLLGRASSHGCRTGFEVGRRRRSRPRRPPPRSPPTCAARRADVVRDRRRRRPTSATRWAPGSASTLALAHPDARASGWCSSAAPAGIDDAARAGRASARPTRRWPTRIERDGVDAFLERWLAQPLFAALPPPPRPSSDRRRNTAAGLASSLRLRRHRHPGPAVGPPRRADDARARRRRRARRQVRRPGRADARRHPRRPSWPSSPAPVIPSTSSSRTRSSTSSSAGWPARPLTWPGL